MVKEIRIYLEGGGDGGSGKASIRKGFNGFLQSLIDSARAQNIRWQIIACGGRDSTFKGFNLALQNHPNSFNVLLVDAENQVEQSPILHLQNRDGWEVKGMAENQCHLMVPTMEAWIIADLQALQNFYGNEFNSNPIPKASNIEVIDKSQIEKSLKTATLKTQKGEYHKIRHAPHILELLNVPLVRSKAMHCNRLFNTLENETKQSSEDQTNAS